MCLVPQNDTIYLTSKEVQLFHRASAGPICPSSLLRLPAWCGLWRLFQQSTYRSIFWLYVITRIRKRVNASNLFPINTFYRPQAGWTMCSWRLLMAAFLFAGTIHIVISTSLWIAYLVICRKTVKIELYLMNETVPSNIDIEYATEYGTMRLQVVIWKRK